MPWRIPKCLKGCPEKPETRVKQINIQTKKKKATVY